MRRYLMIASALLLAGAANASESKFLKGQELRSAVSGRTIYLQTPIGAEVPVRYRPNGTIVGRTSRQLAMLGGEDVTSDRGRWWVRRSQLCQRWNNWSNGREFCYKFQINGSSVRWVRSDGKRGTARIGN